MMKPRGKTIYVSGESCDRPIAEVGSATVNSSALHLPLKEYFIAALPLHFFIVVIPLLEIVVLYFEAYF